MWDWLRSRRRGGANRSLTTPQPNSRQSGAQGRRIDRFLRQTNERLFLFSQPTPIMGAFPPKCIGQPCSQILYGERLEDFSSECWLEDHLHRFGFPESNETNTDSMTVPFEESLDDSTSSSDTFSSGHSSSDLDTPYTLSMMNPRPRMALEELFVPMNVENNTESSSTDFFEDEPLSPPPYSPFEDPPPTYEEAVGSFERRSLGSVSSSSSAFMW